MFDINLSNNDPGNIVGFPLQFLINGILSLILFKYIFNASVASLSLSLIVATLPNSLILSSNTLCF
jgi:hypothetical protein